MYCYKFASRNKLKYSIQKQPNTKSHFHRISILSVTTLCSENCLNFVLHTRNGVLRGLNAQIQPFILNSFPEIENAFWSFRICLKGLLDFSQTIPVPILKCVSGRYPVGKSIHGPIRNAGFSPNKLSSRISQYSALSRLTSILQALATPSQVMQPQIMRFTP